MSLPITVLGIQTPEAVARERDELADRVKRLEGRIAEQRHQLEILNEVAKARVAQLSAMWWVWCSGGCSGGVDQKKTGPLTEEIVRLAERNTKRLRLWYEHAKQRGNAT